MAYRAVLLDVFGTTLRIKSGVHPYRQLLVEGRRNGRRPHCDDARRLMVLNVGLAEAADKLGITIAAQRLREIEQSLEREIESIEPFPDAVEAIALLQSHQIKVGSCSNLAQPYGKTVHDLLPGLDAHALSFEVGVTKPDPLIYLAACQSLGVIPESLFGVERVVMIGDSLRCDCHGPRSVGISGIHLDRTGRGKINNLLDFAKLIVHAPLP